MIANYHTHTHRCNHAIGRERDYIENALSGNLEVLGFADHTPYIFPGGYYSNFRMRPAQLPGYIQTIAELKEEYRGRIQLLTGLETEYYPKHFGDLIAFLRDFPIDYLILGQHFIENEYDAPYCGLVTEEKSVVLRYCSQSMEAMNTGLFTYFAHPDLIHYRGDWKFYQEAVRPMCAEAKRCAMPLEINLLGIREGRHYPNRFFWEVAAEEGCDVILGCDAHSPQAVHVPDAEAKALALAKEFGMKVLHKAELRSIHK